MAPLQSIKTALKCNSNVVALHKNGQISKWLEELRVESPLAVSRFLTMSLFPPSPSGCSLPCKNPFQSLVNCIL